MSNAHLPQIMLGHNAFFGTNHLSAARGAESAEYFSRVERVMNVVETGFEHGARGLMLSTHERAAGILDEIRNRPHLRDELRLYPLLPYAQKYIRRSNEIGMLNVVLESVSGISTGAKLKMLWDGVQSGLSKDAKPALRALIQLELKMFQGTRVGVVFLHDILTDLILAFGLRDIAEFYRDEVRKNFECEAGFTTKNLPTLTARFQEWGIDAPIVMTHFNKVGYNMNPSREACETAAAGSDISILAMGTLASGFLSPEDAYRYLSTVSNIDSVVVGASSSAHISETFEAIDRFGIGK